MRLRKYGFEVEETIIDVMGHNSIQTTERYAQATDERKALGS